MVCLNLSGNSNIKIFSGQLSCIYHVMHVVTKEW